MNKRKKNKGGQFGTMRIGVLAPDTYYWHCNLMSVCMSIGRLAACLSLKLLERHLTFSSLSALSLFYMLIKKHSNISKKVSRIFILLPNSHHSTKILAHYLLKYCAFF